MNTKTKLIQTSNLDVPEFEITREGTYRPKISPEHLRRLWLAKQQTGKFITQIISDALDDYFEKHEYQKGGEKK